MKKLYFILILTLYVGIAYAQTKGPANTSTAEVDPAKKTNADSLLAVKKKADTAKAISGTKQFIRTAASLKSGTSQDVLNSFFKLAYNDLSDGHHFQFSSSLFAIRAKTDTTLWIDTSYRKQVFARNFNFGIDYGVDSNYKFNNASLTVKYAVINKRDKSVFDFDYGKKYITTMDNFSNLFGTAGQKYFGETRSAFKKEKALADSFFNYKNIVNKTPVEKLPARYKAILDSLALLKKFATGNDFKLDSTAETIFSLEYSLRFKSEAALVGNFFNYHNIKDKTPKESLPKRYVAILDSLSNDYGKLRDSLTSMYATISALLAQEPLWTIGAKVTANQQKLFKNTEFNTEYLKGMTSDSSSMGLELDIKANLGVYDTTAVSQSYHRNMFSSSLGINWIIYKDKKTQKSYVEFKPALTYSNIFSGLLPGETKSKFTGDGVLRFRITDDIWIPIDIKYDPGAGKVFGFFSVTSNFDWLGAKSKATGSN